MRNWDVNVIRGCKQDVQYRKRWKIENTTPEEPSLQELVTTGTTYVPISIQNYIYAGCSCWVGRAATQPITLHRTEVAFGICLRSFMVDFLTVWSCMPCKVVFGNGILLSVVVVVVQHFCRISPVSTIYLRWKRRKRGGRDAFVLWRENCFY